MINTEVRGGQGANPTAVRGIGSDALGRCWSASERTADDRGELLETDVHVPRSGIEHRPGPVGDRVVAHPISRHRTGPGVKLLVPRSRHRRVGRANPCPGTAARTRSPPRSADPAGGARRRGREIGSATPSVIPPWDRRSSASAQPDRYRAAVWRVRRASPSDAIAEVSSTQRQRRNASSTARTSMARPAHATSIAVSAGAVREQPTDVHGRANGASVGGRLRQAAARWTRRWRSSHG